ncbi:MBL fold metallo-hydrolase [Tenacibaculum sp. IB213877]|uniref:MBL fold metallo-hydrolase n=1 Tax=Tenacibaculum sp. IB213877 TaxID=3097351 RepID=UPI002A5A5E7F|nr:MBL fold metallo-hydrolase [Tenacibaculum sp. IB213877]MDY0780972.1 MBL fold metallo-hydrolase [Tenacibaculum sp. IB213877]
MKIKQLYTHCLAEATYYIESNGEATIIDPLRETDPYLELLQQNNATLKYIFLTHFHADFVSGHVDLALETGAKIIYGPTAKAEFDFYEGEDGEDFSIGHIILRLLHTPGHTLESSSYLLFDEYGKEHCLFSGDTLFIGDVGRPDLAVNSSISKEDLASKLYTSLHEKIMTLPEDVIIYPNHGKGSACGKNISDKTYDTLKNQKENNYALNPNLSKDDFIKQVLDGLTPPPQYFPKNALLNKSINKNVNDVIKKGLTSINISKVLELLALNEAILLDVRSTEEFISKHVAGSIYIGLDGTFAPWVGTLVKDINQPIILVASKEKVNEAITRLARIGYDNVLGYFDINEWQAKDFETESICSISAFSDELIDAKSSFLDVRRENEFTDNRVKKALHLPLDYIFENIHEFDKKESYYVYCAGGYRSVIAISILKQFGFNKLINVDGGFTDIKKSKIALLKCPNNCPSCVCN